MGRCLRLSLSLSLSLILSLRLSLSLSLSLILSLSLSKPRARTNNVKNADYPQNCYVNAIKISDHHAKKTVARNLQSMVQKALRNGVFITMNRKTGKSPGFSHHVQSVKGMCYQGGTEQILRTQAY